VYVVGDPSLKPEYVSSVELGIDRKIGKQRVNLTGFYRGVDNAIFRVNTVYLEEMVLIRSYTNSGNSKSLGAELNADFKAGDRLKFFLGGSLYNYRIQADIFGYQEDNSSTNWSLKGNTNIMITKQIKFTADFDIISATVTAQGNNDLFYLANTALSYTPAKLANWSFALRVLDIFSSNVRGLDTRAYDSLGEQVFYQKTVYTRQGLIAEIGISYAFNANGKSGKKAESSFGKSEF
jgi:outer membrane cobalamin receptor